MVYIFIDESGDLGISGSKYLVLSALIIEKCSLLDRIIKNMRRHKFRKELSKSNEIKANKSSDEVRNYMIKQLNIVNEAKIVHILLEKKKIHSEFLKNNKHKLYNYVAGKLAKQISLNCPEVEIRIDKSKGKQMLQKDFNDYFMSCLKEKSNLCKVKVYHVHSHSWSGIQFADMLAWACFQKFEHSNNKYIDLIKLEQEVYHVW